MFIVCIISELRCIDLVSFPCKSKIDILSEMLLVSTEPKFILRLLLLNVGKPLSGWIQ